jgi:hypothetical protein
MDLTRRHALTVGGLALAGAALTPSLGRAQTPKRGGTLSLRLWDPPHFDDMLIFITQDDVIYRRVFNPNHRSCVPNFGCYIKAEIQGKMKFFAVSRQMVLFAVERRKAWRMLQSKAGVVNKDYLAQKALLAKLDKDDWVGKRATQLVSERGVRERLVGFDQTVPFSDFGNVLIWVEMSWASIWVA